MTDLIAELAEVVRLGIAASNDEPWQVDAEGDIVCNGEQVAWPITNKLDAPYIAALNNWYRTHHAVIEAMARKAQRYDWLNAHRLDFLARNNMREPRVYLPVGADPFQPDAMDAAIDAAMRDSAREDGES